MGRSKISNKRLIRYRIRKKISGTPERPRLAVFRSNKHIYCQLIDDINGNTLASATSQTIDANGTKIDQAKVVGKDIAEKAMKIGVESVTFDRGGNLYHGRIKSLAEGAREGGLKF